LFICSLRKNNNQGFRKWKQRIWWYKESKCGVTISNLKVESYRTWRCVGAYDALVLFMQGSTLNYTGFKFSRVSYWGLHLNNEKNM
jgi:hypothetical protein